MLQIEAEKISQMMEILEKKREQMSIIEHIS